MITRRAGFVLPAALVLAVTVLPSASGVTPPYAPVDPDEPLVVAELGEETLYGVGVSERAITWGELDGMSVVEEPAAAPSPSAPPSPTTGLSREYRPDLGKSPLTLGASVTPPIAHALNQASTQEWSVGFDPFTMGLGPGYGLTVRHEGGAEFFIPVPLTVMPWDGNISLWGDTALLGSNLVNLNTREAFPFGNPCTGRRAVLADGLLLVPDSCEGTVVALEVPADGITAEVLAGDGWTTVLDEDADEIAYSQGLLVFASAGEGGTMVGYRRLGGDTDTWQRAVDGDLAALRVQGRRFVVVTRDAESPLATAAVFEEGQSPDSAPLAVVDVAASDEFGGVVVLDADLAASGELAATGVAPADPSSDMGLDTVPVDLYGRTLAWSDGERILAATLPALAGGAVTSTAPATGKAGTPVAVTAAGLLPGEEVAVWLESDPALLALGRANADGTFAATVTLPAGAAAGTHTMTVHGVESGWSSARAITLAAAGNPGLRIDTGR